MNMETLAAHKRSTPTVSPVAFRHLGERVDALEAKATAMQTALDTVAKNTSEILSILTHAKSVTGFVKKHAPKVLTFAVGAAMTGGYISAETGHSLTALLGL